MARREAETARGREKEREELTRPETSNQESRQGEWKACLHGSSFRGSTTHSLAPGSPTHGGSSYSAPRRIVSSGSPTTKT